MIQCAAPGLTPWFYSVTADVGDALEGMNFRALEVADETLLNVQALAYVKTSIPRSPSQGRRRRRGACLDAGAPTGRPEGGLLPTRGCGCSQTRSADTYPFSQMSDIHRLLWPPCWIIPETQSCLRS